MVQITTPKETYIVDYPQAIEFAKQQAEIFWLPDEIEVEKDLHDLKTNFTPQEYHGVVTVLKLFTLYELEVGNDYWNHFVCKVFPRPDIQRMATTFSAFEICVHAPFYAKLNEVLGLDTDEFYLDYLNDPILTNRMKWIGKKTIDKGNNFSRLKSLAIFSMIEGAILYSSFAFLKHFQSEGKNKLINVNAGINFSVKDENIHSEAGAWLYRTYLDEIISDKTVEIDLPLLEYEILDTANIIYEHECIIIDKIFEKGEIEGINSIQLKNFVKHRILLCLNRLRINTSKEALDTVGLGELSDIEDTTIRNWFYKSINTSKLHDFFVKQGNEYNRSWNEKRFIW